MYPLVLTKLGKVVQFKLPKDEFTRTHSRESPPLTKLILDALSVTVTAPTKSQL